MRAIKLEFDFLGFDIRQYLGNQSGKDSRARKPGFETIIKLSKERVSPVLSNF